MKYGKLSMAALLGAALLAAGCAPEAKTKPAPKADAKPASKDEAAPHAHGTGPNGGVMFDLGKYHAEFTVDHPKSECTILVIGADEKTPTAVKATEFTLAIKETKTKEGKVVPPMTVMLKPQDAKDGMASKFVGTDPGIGNVADFGGTVVGEIDGQPSQGEFQE